jgi:hypothetical protein
MLYFEYILPNILDLSSRVAEERHFPGTWASGLGSDRRIYVEEEIVRPVVIYGKRMKARKKIGIKFCGGCNPTYERVGMIQHVQSRLGKRFLFLSRYRKDVEVLILMNGCSKACTLEDSKPPEIPYCSVTGEDDFEILMDWLKSLPEKGDF